MDSGELLSPAQDGGAAATSDDSANDIRRIPGTGCSFANEQIHAVATVSYDQGDRQLLQRLTNSARDLSHERTLFKEIERLAGTILTIDVSFYEITRGLRSLTGKIRGNDTLLPVCSVLLGQWSQHHKECSIQEYKDLLWKSREMLKVSLMVSFAGFLVVLLLRGRIPEFRVHVLPFLRDHAIPVAEKQRTIAHQIEVVDRNALRSQKQSQNFKDFSEALKTYVAEFSDEVESLDLDDQNDKVRSLNKELRRAKNAMDV
ncbi:hypothetical protein F5I97DRAFT_1928474 [Phlebopus sp. FC_14]|nr:hypothetical protein F5I97DRAFT_1928474 [Phlebopus sp. FC_14]